MVMLGLLIVAYVQFMIMLADLKGLVLKWKCCVARLLQSYRNGPYQKYMM